MEKLLEDKKLVFTDQMLLTRGTPNPMIFLFGTELVHEFNKEFHSIIAVLDLSDRHQTLYVGATVGRRGLSCHFKLLSKRK